VTVLCYLWGYVVFSRVLSKQYRQYSYGDPFFEGKRSAAATYHA
jgi:hypothetical protein